MVGPGCIFTIPPFFFYFSELHLQPQFPPHCRSQVGTCHQYISTTAILPGGEVGKEIPSSFLSVLSPVILACKNRRENNGHMEILSLRALSSLLSSGVAKKARLARHCVNDTVKRPK